MYLNLTFTDSDKANVETEKTKNYGKILIVKTIEKFIINDTI